MADGDEDGSHCNGLRVACNFVLDDGPRYNLLPGGVQILSAVGATRTLGGNELS